jgi:hypothetical protein
MKMLLRLAGALCAAIAAAGSAAQPNPRGPTEVIVLATLHQYHAKVADYGYADLAAIVEILKPDVLGLELSAEELGARAPQRGKQEYPRSIYPLLEKGSYFTVALEPSGAARQALIDRFAQADRAFTRGAPEQAKAFDAYTSQLFSYLLENWRSACDVNSPQTDSLLEVKHRFQDAVTPPEQAAAWEGWNQHFVTQVKRAAAAHAGKRLLVLVGVEHAYWMRAQLKEQPGIRLADTAALLRTEPRACPAR